MSVAELLKASTAPTGNSTAPKPATPATPAATTNGLKPVTAPNTATTALPSGASTPPAGAGLATGLKPTAATPAAPKPKLNDSVADKVNELTSQDSALMQQAKTDGLKVANRRGLLNSSMAAGAAQDAALRVALPIASQDASQAFQKNMQEDDQEWRSGESGLDRDLQKDMQGKDIASREKLAADERELQKFLQGRDITSREGLAAAERELQRYMQAADLKSREHLAAAERALQERMKAADIQSNADLAHNDRLHQAGQRDLDRKLQEQLASWDLKSSDRNAAAQMLSNMSSLYSSRFDSIMSNPNLDAATRSQQLASINALRDRELGFVRQMYNVDIRWQDNAPSVSAPTAGQASLPSTANKPFNEAAYLAKNPDVAAALRSGKIRSAAEHYRTHGQREGRTW